MSSLLPLFSLFLLSRATVDLTIDCKIARPIDDYEVRTLFPSPFSHPLYFHLSFFFSDPFLLPPLPLSPTSPHGTNATGDRAVTRSRGPAGGRSMCPLLPFFFFFLWEVSFSLFLSSTPARPGERGKVRLMIQGLWPCPPLFFLFFQLFPLLSLAVACRKIEPYSESLRPDRVCALSFPQTFSSPSSVPSGRAARAGIPPLSPSSLFFPPSAGGRSTPTPSASFFPPSP